MDRYFNGSFVAVQGCEGYAALFCGVATAQQAVAVGKTLSDTKRFLLNFSLPTASAANPAFNPNGYWKGSTWLDQVWFAYTGLQVILPIGAEGLDRRGSAGSCRLFLGPGFRLGACWNRLVETVKTRKKREKTGKKWARYGLKRAKEGS